VCVSRIMAFRIKNINMIILICMFSWLARFFTSIKFKKLRHNLQKTAWAYAWAGVNAGMHLRVWLHVRLRGPHSLAHWKALRKAEYSKFLCFAKFETHFSPYFPKIQNLLRHNRIIWISQKNTEYLEYLKNTSFWVKSPFSKYSLYTEYSKMADFWYPKPVRKYRVFIEFIFLQKTLPDSNFNQKFDYEFGTKGVSTLYKK